MQVFAVYEKSGAPDHDADEDVVLVKEGFCWPAFFFSVAWLLHHRLWLPALAALILLIVMAVGLSFFRGAETYAALVMFALALILGAEGNNLRELFLRRSGCAFSGVVAGRSAPEAEMRLFSALGPRIYLP